MKDIKKEDSEEKIVVPTAGILRNKIASFTDLIERYLTENDNYNNTAILDSLYPALQAIEAEKPFAEVLRTIKPEISVFQLNWIMNVLGEHSKMGSEIKTLWERFRQEQIPKKTTRKRTPKAEVPEN